MILILATTSIILLATILLILWHSIVRIEKEQKEVDIILSNILKNKKIITITKYGQSK